MEFRQIKNLDDPAIQVLAKFHKDVRMWLGRFSRSVLVLEDSDKNLWGQAHCLPVARDTYERMISSKKDLRTYLTLDSILTDSVVDQNAADGTGNFCFVGMSAHNLALRKEQYGYFAMPLMVGLQDLFFRIRLRGLVCQSRTAIERHTIASVGCRKRSECKSADGARITLWYFDLECAKKYPLSTLSATLHRIWSEESKLGLTNREQKIVRFAAAGMIDKKIADRLGVVEKTIQKHWENIYDRCRESGVFENLNRAAVIAYCERHLNELSRSEKSSDR